RPLPGSMPTRPRRAALRAGHRGQPPMAGAFGKHSGAVSRARRTPRPYVFRKKEAPGGFEPPNRGFAVLLLGILDRSKSLQIVVGAGVGGPVPEGLKLQISSDLSRPTWEKSGKPRPLDSGPDLSALSERKPRKSHPQPPLP